MVNNSPNKKVNNILKLIGTSEIENIEKYIEEVMNREFFSFTTKEQIKTFFQSYLNDFYESIPYDDIEIIRTYTGHAYNGINSILRNYWDYEKSGTLTEETRRKIRILADDLSNILKDLPVLPINIKVYRGTNLNSFKDYKVTSLNNILDLKEQYYFESGFTSTSLLREKSFFDQDLEWHDDCNIEIEYLIPEECSEALPLISDELSYSKVQNELLINKESLSKIIDVKLDQNKNKAYIKAVLIPQRIWDKSLIKERKTSNK